MTTAPTQIHTLNRTSSFVRNAARQIKIIIIKRKMKQNTVKQQIQCVYLLLLLRWFNAFNLSIVSFAEHTKPENARNENPNQSTLRFARLRRIFFFGGISTSLGTYRLNVISYRHSFVLSKVHRQRHGLNVMRKRSSLLWLWSALCRYTCHNSRDLLCCPSPYNDWINITKYMVDEEDDDETKIILFI